MIERHDNWHDWTDDTEVAPGQCYLGMPNGLYHGSPGVSKSGLDAIHESPLYYQTVRQNPRPPTEAMLLGTALHALVLEPDTFALRYVAAPTDAPRHPNDRERNAKKPSPETVARCAWWDAFYAANGDKIIVPNDDGDLIWNRDVWSTVHYMRDAIMAHPEASIFLTDVISEMSVYWIDPGTHRFAKCRPDAFNASHRILLDLKSAREATLSGFQRSVHDYRYDVQAAWYLDGCRLSGILADIMVFVACEKTPPYHCATYEIDPEWVRQGRIKYQADLHTYHQCMEAQEWPSIPNITRVLPIPGYARWNPIS